jgi:hypothetical protein
MTNIPQYLKDISADLISRMDDWLFVDFLPMKNNGRLGVLSRYDLESKKFVLYHTNIWGISSMDKFEWEALDKTTFSSIQEMLDLGWYVD